LRPDATVETMPSQTRTLLCIEPNTTQQALIKRFAERHGLNFETCNSESAALALLGAGQSYEVMVIAHHLKEGNSFQIIEAARLSLRHATLPIAFVMSDRDLRLAQNVMNIGATEVFLRSEHESLLDFIGDCSSAKEISNFGGKTLLVEDSDAQAQYITHLCQALGMEVDRAQDVDSAQALFKKNTYQILIVDIVLNDTKSGISFVKSVRQNHALRQPILVMSGFNDLPRRLLAIRSGADDFISKPFAPEEFVWRLKKIMNGYAGQDFGEKDLQPTEKRVARSDFINTLSPREREICDKVLAGTSDREIASELGISFWTVRSHIQQIFTKTGALNRRELMARFIPSPNRPA
jgi:DNA-binding NarL/FixJ family response regulator